MEKNSKSSFPKKRIQNAGLFLLKAEKRKTLSMIFLVVFFVFVIFMSSFSAILYNRNFYDAEYKKNNVYEKYGYNITWAVTNNILNFFRNKEDIGQYDDYNLRLENNASFESIDSNFFSYNEKSHMHDVKQKIRTSFFAYYISIILIVVFFSILYFNSFNFLRDLGIVFLITSGIVFLLGLNLYFADFSALFDLFHRIIFTGNYTFPETSNLIGFFPLKFFGEFAYRIIFFSFIKSAVFLLTGIILVIGSKK